MRQAGRHFLQIPGPSPVPDRILRAIDMPVIDHRGPGFADQSINGRDRSLCLAVAKARAKAWLAGRTDRNRLASWR